MAHLGETLESVFVQRSSALSRACENCFTREGDAMRLEPNDKVDTFVIKQVCSVAIS